MSKPTYAPDLFTPAAIKSPHRHYQAMRAIAPLVWLEATGCWATTTYAAATDVLARHDCFVSGQGVSLNDATNKMLVGSTLNSDGEAHSQRKKVSIRPLMPKNVSLLEPQIRAASQALVSHLPQRVEAVSQIAQHLPLNIVTQLVGLPQGREQDMLTWAAATFNFMGPANDIAKAHEAGMSELRAFITDPETERRLSPDGWAAALFAAEAAGRIPAGWANEQMRDYLNPSLDTTIAATAFGLMLFAKNPDQWDLLRQNPDRISNAVEEMVRLCTPIRGLSRHVNHDTEVCGVPLSQGDRVWVLFAAANRDPSVFSLPDDFDVTRQTSRHLGFGQGKHFCLGMHLARAEIRILLETLVGRVKRFHLDGEPEVSLNNIIYGLSKLPLRMEFDAS